MIFFFIYKLIQIMINLNIYVIHSSTLKEREQNIDNLKQLANSQQFFNISFTTVCDHEASSIQMKNIKNLIKLGKVEEG